MKGGEAFAVASLYDGQDGAIRSRNFRGQTRWHCRPPSPATLTNAATPEVAISPATNSPSAQSDVWQKNTPSLNGINYHW